MKRAITSDNIVNAMMTTKRWLTLEQLLEVLPFKKSHVHYLTHTRQTPVTRIGRRLLFGLRSNRRMAGGNDDKR